MSKKVNKFHVQYNLKESTKVSTIIKKLNVKDKWKVLKAASKNQFVTCNLNPNLIYNWVLIKNAGNHKAVGKLTECSKQNKL